MYWEKTRCGSLAALLRKEACSNRRVQRLDGADTARSISVAKEALLCFLLCNRKVQQERYNGQRSTVTTVFLLYLSTLDLPLSGTKIH